MDLTVLANDEPAPVCNHTAWSSTRGRMDHDAATNVLSLPAASAYGDADSSGARTPVVLVAPYSRGPREQSDGVSRDDRIEPTRVSLQAILEHQLQVDEAVAQELEPGGAQYLSMRDMDSSVDSEERAMPWDDRTCSGRSSYEHERGRETIRVETVGLTDPPNQTNSTQSMQRKCMTPEERRKARTCIAEGCTNYIVHKHRCFRHGVRRTDSLMLQLT